MDGRTIVSSLNGVTCTYWRSNCMLMGSWGAISRIKTSIISQPASRPIRTALARPIHGRAAVTMDGDAGFVVMTRGSKRAESGSAERSGRASARCDLRMILRAPLRQFKPEHRPLPHPALCADLPAVQFDKLAGNRKPQPRAFLAAGGLVGQPGKLAEKLGQFRLRDTGAGILHLHPQMHVGHAGADHHRRPRWAELDGIADQVAGDLH